MERDGCDGGKAKARGEREREREARRAKKRRRRTRWSNRGGSLGREFTHTRPRLNIMRTVLQETSAGTNTARANEYDEYTDDGLLSSGCRVHSWRSLARMHAAASSVHTARTRDVAASLDLDLLS